MKLIVSIQGNVFGQDRIQEEGNHHQRNCTFLAFKVMRHGCPRTFGNPMVGDFLSHIQIHFPQMTQTCFLQVWSVPFCLEVGVFLGEHTTASTAIMHHFVGQLTHSKKETNQFLWQ